MEDIRGPIAYFVPVPEGVYYRSQNSIGAYVALRFFDYARHETVEVAPKSDHWLCELADDLTGSQRTGLHSESNVGDRLDSRPVLATLWIPAKGGLGSALIRCRLD